MKRNNYPADFKEQALSKAHERGDKTLQAIADELNLSLGTLKTWLKQSGMIWPPKNGRHEVCKVDFLEAI